jgi:hypothetical protein
VLNAGDKVGRPFVMSKQVADDRVAIIRKAFDDTMQDPAFRADMAKQQLPVNPLTSKKTEKIVAGLMSVPPKIAAEAKAIYD